MCVVRAMHCLLLTALALLARSVRTAPIPLNAEKMALVLPASIDSGDGFLKELRSRISALDWMPVEEWAHHDEFNIADAFGLDPDDVRRAKRELLEHGDTL